MDAARRAPEAPAVPAVPRVPRATLPDLRQEQFFLTTVRKHIEVAEPDTKAVVPASASETPWQHTAHIAWLPFLYSVFMEQVISPIWQGMLWGLGGVALAHCRQLYAIARAQRMRSPTARATTIAKEAEKTAPMRETLGSWIARLGLSRIFV